MGESAPVGSAAPRHGRHEAAGKGEAPPNFGGGCTAALTRASAPLQCNVQPAHGHTLCTPGTRWWRRKRCTLPTSQAGSTTAGERQGQGPEQSQSVTPGDSTAAAIAAEKAGVKCSRAIGDPHAGVHPAAHAVQRWAPTKRWSRPGSTARAPAMQLPPSPPRAAAMARRSCTSPKPTFRQALLLQALTGSCRALRDVQAG